MRVITPWDGNGDRDGHVAGHSARDGGPGWGRGQDLNSTAISLNNALPTML